jgi:transcriptional regulator with XRE-family HTH domain
MSARDEVEKLIRETSENPDKVMETMSKVGRACAVVDTMTDIRIGRGLSQRDLAARANMSASKVCRMEAESDDDLKLGDLKRYLGGLGISIHLLLDDSTQPGAAKIKQMVMEIGRQLELLSKLAESHDGDKELAEGIMKFRSEVLLNFIVRYGQTRPKVGLPPPMDIELPPYDEAEDAIEEKCQLV